MDRRRKHCTFFTDTTTSRVRIRGEKRGTNTGLPRRLLTRVLEGVSEGISSVLLTISFSKKREIRLKLEHEAKLTETEAKNGSNSEFTNSDCGHETNRIDTDQKRHRPTHDRRSKNKKVRRICHESNPCLTFEFLLPSRRKPTTSQPGPASIPLPPLAPLSVDMSRARSACIRFRGTKPMVGNNVLPFVYSRRAWGEGGGIQVGQKGNPFVSLTLSLEKKAC